MELHVKLEDRDEQASPVPYLTQDPRITSEETIQGSMTSSHVALVPSSLARPPVQWSVQEVKAWLEFCVKEFSLRPLCVDKFDMNGKALLLLTRTDFLERSPDAGDVLYNVFQRLLQSESPGYLRSVFLTTPAHFPSQAAEIVPLPLQVQGSRSSFIPILPQPKRSSSNHSNSGTYSTTSSSIMLAAGDNHRPAGPSVPASMLSPAPSEKCTSDTDSSHNDNGQSPHDSDHEMECEEGVNFDPGREVKYDTADHNEEGVCRLLWEFIYQLLQDSKWSELVSWESVDDLTFRILNPTNLADAWGQQKNRSNMTYEKLSRALRYYYKMNIIKKVPGKRLTYKFLQHPATIRKGQRGARPHSSRNAATSESELAALEPKAPDSSTYLPARTLSVSSTSSTITLFASDPTSDVGSPKRHHISEELSEDQGTKPSFRRDIHELHFLTSPQDSRGSSHEQGSFIYQENSNGDVADAAANSRGTVCVLSEEHFEIRKKRQRIYCDPRHDNEFDGNNIVCSSLPLTVNTSPQKTVTHMPQAVTNTGHRYVSNGHATTGVEYGNNKHHSLSTLEHNSELITYCNLKLHNHKSHQDLIEEKANIIARSSSPSFITSTPAHIRSSALAKSSRDTTYPKIYHQNNPGLHHPHSHPQPNNGFPPLPLQMYDQPHTSHISSEYYKRSPKQQLNHQQSPTNFHLDSSNYFPQSVTDPYYIHNPLKQEVSETEQEEPEDLSLKPCLQKTDFNKSEPDLPQGSAVTDAHRESPRSNSSDSAYGSDRADFVNDILHAGLHE